MAVIVENLHGRRMVRVSTDDVISIIREYQSAVCGVASYDRVREILDRKEFFLPEDI